MTAEETAELLERVQRNYPEFRDIMREHGLDVDVAAQLVYHAAEVPLSRPGQQGRMMRAAAHMALGYQLAKELEGKEG